MSLKNNGKYPSILAEARAARDFAAQACEVQKLVYESAHYPFAPLS